MTPTTYPEQLKRLMMHYQVEQGNEKDWSVFERDIRSEECDGGFLWIETPEGSYNWHQWIVLGNFHDFFSYIKDKPEYAWLMEEEKDSIESMTNGIRFELLKTRPDNTQLIREAVEEIETDIHKLETALVFKLDHLTDKIQKLKKLIG